MPIKIPNDLPATKILNDENIFVITETRAITQDIRPLHILILNLMPTKIVTETQLARILGNTPLQVELDFLQMATHKSTHTAAEHMIAFYKTFDEVRHRKFDGMVITGAPVEQMPFEEVNYWDELCAIMEWSKKHVTSTFHICWGAQAGLYYHYGIEKRQLDKKLFGVYKHKIEYKNSILFRGVDDEFYAPHSRYTTVLREDIEKIPELRILASSDMAGIYAVMTDMGKQIFVMGHSEYDADTLKKEYLRDKDAGLCTDLPYNYFPENDDKRMPLNVWKSHANLLYSNWLNYYVYQTTPYDINEISGDREAEENKSCGDKK